MLDKVAFDCFPNEDEQHIGGVKEDSGDFGSLEGFRRIKGRLIDN